MVKNTININILHKFKMAATGQAHNFLMAEKHTNYPLEM